MLWETPDVKLAKVAAWLHRKPLREKVAAAVRSAIDAVVDGPSTGRWAIAQLEKTEKTYVGTRVEIRLRTELGLRREGPLDTLIEGEPVDIKWSITSVWEIPPEAVDQVCLVVGTNRAGTLLDVGLIRPRDEYLNRPNRDGKRTLSQAGRARITWLEQSIPLEPHFLASLPADVVARIMEGRTGMERIRRLVQSAPHRVFNRAAIETVAQQKDPMRRVRKDGTRLGGMVVLGGKYSRDRLAELGFPNVMQDEYVAFPEEELARNV